MADRGNKLILHPLDFTPLRDVPQVTRELPSVPGLEVEERDLNRNHSAVCPAKLHLGRMTQKRADKLLLITLKVVGDGGQQHAYRLSQQLGARVAEDSLDRRVDRCNPSVPGEGDDSAQSVLHHRAHRRLPDSQGLMRLVQSKFSDFTLRDVAKDSAGGNEHSSFQLRTDVAFDDSFPPVSGYEFRFELRDLLARGHACQKFTTVFHAVRMDDVRHRQPRSLGRRVSKGLEPSRVDVEELTGGRHRLNEVRRVVEDVACSLLASTQSQLGKSPLGDIFDRPDISRSRATLITQGSGPRMDVADVAGRSEKPQVTPESPIRLLLGVIASEELIPLRKNHLCIVGMDGASPPGSQGILSGHARDLLPPRIRVETLAGGIGLIDSDGCALTHDAKPPLALCELLLCPTPGDLCLDAYGSSDRKFPHLLPQFELSDHLSCQRAEHVPLNRG